MLSRFHIGILSGALGLLLGLGSPFAMAHGVGMVTQRLGANMEASSVNIKVVDPRILWEHNGKPAYGEEERRGQGIIIDSTGVIATNTHIIGDNPLHIYVTLADGHTFEGHILREGKPDVMLIKIEANYGLKAVTLADSSQAQINNQVLAYCNAALNHARQQSGKITQVYREETSNIVEILQMNIPLQAGDSGGPVINEKGSLVGLIMANQKSDPSKSYAIASNRIQQEYLEYKSAGILN